MPVHHKQCYDPEKTKNPTHLSRLRPHTLKLQRPGTEGKLKVGIQAGRMQLGPAVEMEV